MKRAAKEWDSEKTHKPRWRQEIDNEKEKWNVTRPLAEGEKPKCLSRIGFDVAGQVDIDLKSHTTPEQREGVGQEAVWTVNAHADEGTHRARHTEQKYESIDVPTGGYMFFYMSGGAMWTQEAGRMVK